MTGRLRRQFYSDIFHLGDGLEAPRQVATAYMCLATTISWLACAAGLAILNPTQPEIVILASVNACATLSAFFMLRRKRDPQAAMDWLLALSFISIAWISTRHSGVIAPIVFSLPTVVCAASLYQKPSHRLASLLAGCVMVLICALSALGIIGEPTPYPPRIYTVIVFLVIVGATLCLGGIAWISVMSRDYTLEKFRRTNEAIVDSAARARIALEQARVGLWDVPNTNEHRFNVSDSFQAVTGYSGEEFSAIFGAVERFVHPDDVKPLRDAFAIGRERLTRIRIDFRLLTKSRGYRWFSARARYSTNSDGTARISGSLQDINFIKVAEEALRAGRDQARAANKAKSDFIAVMSHEVRTPLNAILGSVDLLKRTLQDEEPREMIELIDEAGRGLLAMVNDLLDVSRIDAGKLEILPSPIELSSLIRRTVEFWTPQASDKGLSLTVECAEACDGELMLDAGRIRQVIGNLISNAVKFTDTGSIAVTYSTQPASDGRAEVTIAVRDTGPGVPPAVAEAIFAPFEQGPGDASRGGAGLGLFISRRLARMMGGDLTLEAVESGAHFRLTLLADRVGAEPGVTIEPPPLPEAGLHILCVDDNEKNRRIAELLLTKMGFEVTLAASGAEAVDLCAMQVFDLILMDIVMPDMDGRSTLLNLRADDEGLNRATPALALTAKLSPADLTSYRASGFEGVSPKPIDIPALAGEIARITAARRADSAK